MNAYVVILQKVVGTEQIIKPYEETKKVLHKKMTFDDTIESQTYGKIIIKTNWNKIRIPKYIGYINT